MSAKITADENSFEYLFTKLDSNIILKTLEYNYNIDYSQDGTNLLHKLAYNNNLSKECYLKILSLDLNVNAKSVVSKDNKGGLTPLVLSMISGKVGLSTILLEKGADPYIQDERGNDAFYYANIVPNKKVIKKVLEKYKN